MDTRDTRWKASTDRTAGNVALQAEVDRDHVSLLATVKADQEGVKEHIQNLKVLEGKLAHGLVALASAVQALGGSAQGMEPTMVFNAGNGYRMVQEVWVTKLQLLDEEAESVQEALKRAGFQVYG